MVAGREATPADAGHTAKLELYWTKGEGAAKIRWGQPGDFDRCRAEVGKVFAEHGVSPAIISGLCSNYHVMATGARPGHAATEQGPRTGHHR